MSLIALVYRSKKTKVLSQDELEDLVALSAKNNRSLVLSGFLISTSNEYYQYLEGHPSDLEAVMEKIVRDPRHTDLKSYSFPIKKRICRSWNMRLASESRWENIGYLDLIRSMIELKVPDKNKDEVFNSRTMHLIQKVNDEYPVSE